MILFNMSASKVPETEQQLTPLPNGIGAFDSPNAKQTVNGWKVSNLRQQTIIE
jgi:hypothetical protein